jgi:hypothetical protein
VCASKKIFWAAIAKLLSDNGLAIDRNKADVAAYLRSISTPE